jgi:hypothetical protein
MLWVALEGCGFLSLFPLPKRPFKHIFKGSYNTMSSCFFDRNFGVIFTKRTFDRGLSDIKIRCISKPPAPE